MEQESGFTVDVNRHEGYGVPGTRIVGTTRCPCRRHAMVNSVRRCSYGADAFHQTKSAAGYIVQWHRIRQQTMWQACDTRCSLHGSLTRSRLFRQIGTSVAYSALQRGDEPGRAGEERIQKAPSSAWSGGVSSVSRSWWGWLLWKTSSKQWHVKEQTYLLLRSTYSDRTQPGGQASIPL